MRTSLIRIGLLSAAASLHSSPGFAEENLPYTEEQMRKCLEHSVLTADKTMTVQRMEEACAILLSQPAVNAQSSTAPETIKESGIEQTKASASEDTGGGSTMLKDRLELEALNRSNRFVLIPHRRNYILPVSYSASPNYGPYEEADNTTDEDDAFLNLKHTEVEFQLSVKILLMENLFTDNGQLYLGYTNHSIWQVYNRKASAPFRETNHQPELILSFSNDFEIFGFRNVLNEISLNHQSNGQSGLLSRSWNRVMFNSVFEGKNFSFMISPWYRLPEEKSKYPGDPRGDDNPDITHYMGNFQFTGAYKYKSNIFSAEVRNNLKSDNRGAVELGWTFPLTSTMRGYVNYFDGYGHSLIDYNERQQVFGLGVTFTDLF